MSTPEDLPEPPSTRSELGCLRILVTNDDGVAALGMDVLVRALRAMVAVQVTVFAPAKNQSGTGGQTSEGQLTAAPAKTVSGSHATAVDGFPADAVVYALDGGHAPWRPHLVVSGINDGQNLGPIVNASGTGGAARAAVQRGIPAVAISQGFSEEPAFDAAAQVVTAWIERHRDVLMTSEAQPTQIVVTNINVPSCTRGCVRDLVEVSLAKDLEGSFETPNCLSTLASPQTDVEAVQNGFASSTVLGPAPTEEDPMIL